ncbi:MAG: DUF2726 domain-containing protein [Anaerolineae bacterium]|nr:DUF2726 domain-containing protein [Anaerolineae bacterium]
MTTTEESPGCLSFIRKLFGPGLQKSETLPYRLRDRFLSPAEISFYHVLNSIVLGQAVICPKVRMIDVLYISNRRDNFSYVGKISQKHIDFLICDSGSMKPILAIELDDSSHQRPDRAKRDAFVDRAFDTARLPLIHIPARRSYNTDELANLVRPYINVPSREASTVSPDRTAGETTAPLCPNCGVAMVKRTATKGKHAGKPFWACPNYPECRQIIAIES